MNDSAYLQSNSVNASQIETLLKRYHFGERNGASVKMLCSELSADQIVPERHVRKIIEGMRMDGLPVCAHPSKGYFWAANDAELEETVSFLKNRAITSLTQAARLQRMALPELIGQLALDIKIQEA